MSRWPRWRGHILIRQFDVEDHAPGGPLVIVDGRFPVAPVNVKTVRAALEAAEADPGPRDAAPSG